MKNIAIIGSGSFGCALAHQFGKNNNVIMWSYTKEETDSINNDHRCLFIPEIKLNSNIKCFQDYKEVINGSEIIVLVTPSSIIKKTCEEIKSYITNQEIVLASKGLENDILLSNIIKEELGITPSVIMGPSFAIELGTDKKTFVELSGNRDLADIFSTDSLIINYNNDPIGLQIGGALKNVVTVCCGLVEGLGHGVNTISYVITEGLNELKKIGMTLGAKESTFYGLSGLGDLYGTAAGTESRNKKAGILLGKGKKLEEVKKEVGQTIEGLETIKDAKYIIDKYNLDCELISNLYEVIYNNKDINSIIK